MFVKRLKKGGKKYAAEYLRITLLSLVVAAVVTALISTSGNLQQVAVLPAWLGPLFLRVFVQAFESPVLDASLLLLPIFGFVDADDERMIRTVEAIREELTVDGLLRRYQVDDLECEEGAFLACSFWLVEYLARQGELEEGRAVFRCAASTGNDLGLFSEEYDTSGKQMLGNFPQALTHLSLIAAAVALDKAEP